MIVDPTLPRLEWFYRVDREEIVQAVRQATDRSGLLVFTGDQRTGLDIAAALADETLQGLGWETSVALVARDTPQRVREALLPAVKALLPRPTTPGHLSPETALAGASTPTVMRAVVEELRRNRPRHALILREVPYTPAMAADLRTLEDLLRQRTLLAILTSSADSSSWQAVVQRSQVVALSTRFSRSEVRDCMLRAANTLGLSTADVDGLLETRLFPRGRVRIAPSMVYALLKSVAS